MHMHMHMQLHIISSMEFNSMILIHSRLFLCSCSRCCHGIVSAAVALFITCSSFHNGSWMWYRFLLLQNSSEPFRVFRIGSFQCQFNGFANLSFHKIYIYIILLVFMPRALLMCGDFNYGIAYATDIIHLIEQFEAQQTQFIVPTNFRFYYVDTDAVHSINRCLFLMPPLNLAAFCRSIEWIN